MAIERYIDLQELSERLSLSPRSIRTYVTRSDNPLPAYRIGGKLLFRWDEVEKWVERHRVHMPDVNVDVDELINTIANKEH